MSSTCVRALARLAAALSLLVAMSGCKFEPGGQPPGEGPGEDSGPRADGAPLPVDSGSGIDSTVTRDSAPEIDAMPPPPPDAVDNRRRKQITIDGSRVEAPVPGILENFPVLFSVVDPELAARASADGSDIHFVGIDGLVPLDHEIEKWDPDTGRLVAWVKIPMLLADVDTVFYVVYGDPGRTQPENPTGVWSSDFAAVWHLSQDPGPGMPGGITDSTTGNDGTAHSSMQSSDLVPGQIGDGIDFDGSDDEITFTNPISGNMSHTISAWVRQEGTGSQDSVVTLGNGEMNRARWLHSVYFGGTLAAGFYSNDHTTNVDIRDDGWTLLHWTYDGTRSRLHVNGEQAGSSVTPSAGIDTEGSEGRIGDAREPEFGQNMNLNGQIDEVRIATVARPAEWIQTEFNNQLNPSTFYMVGPETK
jgi:hypothetical protein